LSLYFFPNSGWSQDNLYVSNTYTSLFSRHYLPIIMCVAVLLALKSQENRILKILLLFSSIQNIALQLFLYHQLYNPI
jgi:phosphoglycerol transferase MdoB-like AlkP superfamily enzyme